jgi:uncharacterized protein
MLSDTPFTLGQDADGTAATGGRTDARGYAGTLDGRWGGMTNEHPVGPEDDPVTEAVSPAKAGMIDADSPTPVEAAGADAPSPDGTPSDGTTPDGTTPDGTTRDGTTPDARDGDRVPAQPTEAVSPAKATLAALGTPPPAPRPQPLRVLIAGASGTIGTEVIRQLEAAGHTAIRLVRRAADGPHEVSWSPAEGRLDPAALEGIDAVVNLSGATISRVPWTPPYRRKILESRISATRTLTEAMAAAATPPAAFLSGSAEGFYGDRPGEILTETSRRGFGFLPEVVDAWESAARQAPAGTRVVLLRTGIVLAESGALKPIRLLTNLGVSGPLGGGQQHWPWISLHDEAAAIVHLLASSSLSGPVNLVGPTPATADRLMRYLARRSHRPYLLPAPRLALTLALGDAGRELLLASRRMSAARLLEDGFTFAHPHVNEAVDWALDRTEQGA